MGELDGAVTSRFDSTEGRSDLKMHALRGESSKSDVIRCLKKLADELGRSPTQADACKKEGWWLVNSAAKRFGTWNKAKKAAGLKIYHPPSTTLKRRLRALKEEAKSGNLGLEEVIREAGDDPLTQLALRGGWALEKFNEWTGRKLPDLSKL